MIYIWSCQVKLKAECNKRSQWYITCLWLKKRFSLKKKILFSKKIQIWVWSSKKINMKIKKLFIFENVILPSIPPDCNGLSNLLIKKRIFYIERRLLTLAPPLSKQTKGPFVQRTYEHQQYYLHMLHFILFNAQPTKKCPLGNEVSHMSQSLLIFFLLLFLFLLLFSSFLLSV